MWNLSERERVPLAKNDVAGLSTQQFSSEEFPQPEEKDFTGDYLAKILLKLTDHPQIEQSSFLLKLFGAEGLNFPNGEDLANFYAKVINIPWCNPNPAVTINEVKPLVTKHYYERTFRYTRGHPPAHLLVSTDLEPSLVYSGLEYLKPPNSFEWNNFRYRITSQQREGHWTALVGLNSGLVKSLFPEYDVLKSSSHSRASSVLNGAAGTILVKDQLEDPRIDPKYQSGNAYLPLVDIYNLGLIPGGEVDHGTPNVRFIVIKPEKVKVSEKVTQPRLSPMDRLRRLFDK